MQYINTGSLFSPCKNYRYSLWRIWDTNQPIVLFIGLNPSTADANYNDPTIRRCISFAKHWDYGGIYVANLFAWRTPHPSVLKKTPNPIGNKTNYWLAKLNNDTHLTIACWGNHGNFRHRDKDILTMLPDLHCLRITKKGNPAHPLYLAKTLLPIPFNPTQPAGDQKTKI
ncbi:MAG: DUF1643 domain-containing protein [Cyanobacteria bacterium P01_E01_bin.6]